MEGQRLGPCKDCWLFQPILKLDFGNVLNSEIMSKVPDGGTLGCTVVVNGGGDALPGSGPKPLL